MQILRLYKKSIYSVTTLLLIFAFSSILLFFFATKPKAAINETINFQGRLVDSDGTNFSGACGTSCNIAFRIYDNSTGGSILWEETQTTSVSDGIFNVALGSSTAFDDVGYPNMNFNRDDLYLQIEVDADGVGGTYEEVFDSPRIRFTAVPYALNSKSLDGIDSSGFVQIVPSSTQVLGLNEATGTLIDIDESDANNAFDLFNLAVGGTSRFNINNDGSITINSVTGSDSNINLGSGTDSFNITNGNLVIGGGTPTLPLNGEDAYISGTFEVGGNSKLGGNVDFDNNEAQNFRLENLAAPPACNVNTMGKEFYDTANDAAFVCVESPSGSGTYIWFDFTTSAATTASKVVTVGTGGNYATISAAASYLSGVTGGIILLTPETHNVTTSVDLEDITLIGANTGDTRIDITGGGELLVKETQFKSLTIDIDSGITANSGLNAKYDASTTSSVIFEWVDFIMGGTKVLIDSTEATAPILRTRFISTNASSGNQDILLSQGSANLNATSNHFVESQGGSGSLDFQDWDVEIAGSANVVTSGAITTIPNNTIFLYPGMNFQSAINSLPGGGVIVLLPGTHSISSTVNINNDSIEVRGYGDASIIEASGFAGITATTAAIQIGAADGTAPSDDVVLRDLRLEVNGSDIHGIRTAGGEDIQIYNVSVVKTSGQAGNGANAKVGIHFIDGTTEQLIRPVIQNSRVFGDDSGAGSYFTDGIHITSDGSIGGVFGNGQGAINALVDGNNIDYVRETAAVFVGVNDSSLFNNRFSRMGAGGGGAYGLYIGNANRINMNANTVSGSLSATSTAIGIESFNVGSLKEVRNSVFNSNIIDGTANGGLGFQTGFVIGNATNTGVHENVFENNTVTGASTTTTTAFIVNGNADNNIFVNNVISGGTNAWNTGINLSSTNQDNNTLRSNKPINVTTPISDSGTATKLGVSQHHATVDPTVTDDISANYDIGTVWINTTSDDAFILLDNTVGAAVWTQIDGGAGGSGTSVELSPSSIQLTGNTANTLININEDGTGTPDLLNLEVGGASRINIDNDGALTIDSVSGTNALLVKGNGTDRLSVLTDGTLVWTGASGVNTTFALGDGTDSFNITTGNLVLGNGSPTLTLDGEDAYIEGTLEIDGTADFGSTVDFNNNINLNDNQTQNLRIENLAVAPTCDGTVIGKIYHNTVDTLSYICDGTTWNSIEGGEGLIELAPSTAQSTGDTTNTLININEDGTGTSDLLNLAVAGTSRININNDGALTIDSVSGTNALLVKGNGTDRLSVLTDGTFVWTGASGVDATFALGSGTDNFNVTTGNLIIGDGSPTLTLDGEDAYIEGTLEVDGNVDIGGNVNFNDNQAIDLRIENSSTETCDASVSGKIYHDTDDSASYVCDGSNWKQIDADPSVTVIGQFYDSTGGTDVNTGAFTPIPWDAETREDPGITHDNVTNNTRVQLDGIGWYKIDYFVSSDTPAPANGGYNIECQAQLNGVAISPSTSYSNGIYAGGTYIANELTNSSSFLVQTTSANEYYEVLCQGVGSGGSTTPTQANESWTNVEKVGGTTLGSPLDLDDIYANDSDQTLNVNDANGLSIDSTSIGNINIDLQSTGDFVIQDNGTDIFTLNDSGSINVNPLATTTAGFSLNTSTITSGTGLEILYDSATMTGAGYALNIMDGATSRFSIGDDGVLTWTGASGADANFALATGTDSFNITTGNLIIGNGTPTLTLNGEDAYIEGTLEVDGVVDFGSNIDFNDNEAQSFRIENLATAPTCDGSVPGKIYHNTTDSLSYVCDGTIWKQIDGGAGGSLPSELPAVQARRTTDFTMAAATTWYDITFDSTDIESDNLVIEHNNTNTERIDIKEDGLYQISYNVTGNDTGATHGLEARVEQNGTTVLNGSYLLDSNYQNEYSAISTSFFANLNNGDYITLQAQRTTANTIINETKLIVVKLEGSKGDTGATGDPTSSDLDEVYGNDTDQTLDLTDANGLTVNVDSSASGGNFVINDEGTGDVLTVDSSGNLIFDQLTNCDILYTDATGQVTCGNDQGAAFSAYDSDTDLAITTTATTIDIDATNRTQSNYTLAGDNVTVNSDGTYEITFTCTLDETSGNNRSDFRCWMERDTGGGFNTINGTECYAYSRNAAEGIGSCSQTVVLDSTNGDDYRIRAVRNNGGNTFTTVANGSSINFSKIIAPGADLAEIYYTTDEDVVAGNVVSIDESIHAGVQMSDGQYDKMALGVISTQPGKVIGAEPDIETEGRPVLVALSGRVPVKIDPNSEPIEAGDYITSSDTPGYAMKATQPGIVVGKALESWYPIESDTITGDQTILIFVGTASYDPGDGKIYENMNPYASPTYNEETGKYEGGINLGSIDNYFNEFYATSATLSNSDLSEEYKAVDPDITAGDVVALDYGAELAIDKTNSAYQRDVMGVVSTSPGITFSNLNLSEEERSLMRPVALAGRIPVKVSTENGPIQKGDYLVPSSTPGYAMKACGTNTCESGLVIGTALEDFDDSQQGDTNEVSTELEETNKEVTGQIDEIIDGLESQLEDVQTDFSSSSTSEQIEIQEQISGLNDIEKVTKELTETIDDAPNGKGRVMMFVNMIYFDANPFHSQADVSNNPNDDSPSTGDTLQSTGNTYTGNNSMVNGGALQGDFVGAIELDALIVTGDALFEGDITVKGHVTFSEDTVGQAIISEGHTKVQVEFENEYSNPPIVTVNPIDFDGKYKLLDITTEGFSIEIKQIEDQDISFNWHAFGADDLVVTKSKDNYEEELEIYVLETPPDDSKYKIILEDSEETADDTSIDDEEQVNDDQEEDITTDLSDENTETSPIEEPDAIPNQEESNNGELSTEKEIEEIPDIPNNKEEKESDSSEPPLETNENDTSTNKTEEPLE